MSIEEIAKLPQAAQTMNPTMKLIAQYLVGNPELKPYFHNAKVKYDDKEVTKVQIKLIDASDSLIVVTISKKPF